MSKSAIKSVLKSVLVPVFDSRLVAGFIERRCPETSIVLMLHRFQSDVEPDGHRVEDVVASIGLARRRGFEFVAVDELFEQERGSIRKKIAITLDDGYRDQFEFASSVLHKLECPATIFAVTEFLTGKMWPFEAKCQFLFQELVGEDVSVTWLPNRVSINSNSTANRIADSFIQLTRRESVSKRIQLLSELSDKLGIHVPNFPPSEFASIPFESEYRFFTENLRVGSHTENHAILSNESDVQAEQEIRNSRSFLQDRMGESMSNVFCYPYGEVGDYGERDLALAKKHGFTGAVNAIPGYLDFRDDRYDLHRFGFSSNKLDFIQQLRRVEQLKEIAFGKGD